MKSIVSSSKNNAGNRLGLDIFILEWIDFFAMNVIVIIIVHIVAGVFERKTDFLDECL